MLAKDKLLSLFGELSEGSAWCCVLSCGEGKRGGDWRKCGGGGGGMNES